MSKFKGKAISYILLLISLASVAIGAFRFNHREVIIQSNYVRVIDDLGVSNIKNSIEIDDFEYYSNGDEIVFSTTRKFNLSSSSINYISDSIDGQDDVNISYTYSTHTSDFTIEIEKSEGSQQIIEQIVAKPFLYGDDRIDFYYDFDGEIVTGSDILLISQINQIGWFSNLWNKIKKAVLVTIAVVAVVALVQLFWSYSINY